MPGVTKNYQFGYFDAGDTLGTASSEQIERDRFLLLDKLLYGIMTIFGNGVVAGWSVSATAAFELEVAPGRGIINFLSARSDFAATIGDIPPNSVKYVYAQAIRSTAYAEEVEFFLSPVNTLEDPNYILLARVVSGSTAIQIVDNSVRNEIDFLEIIKEAIRTHKHRGGVNNPSKIDLTSEVKGQLSPFNIAPFDAEKVNTGTFDLARMPRISHSSLQNVGLLTHEQLDTFVKTLESSNKELFGEIGSANLLQMIIALKLIYEDASSSFYIKDEVVDKSMINEFAVIPGITPDERIDFANSTAEINLSQHYIQGIAATVGSSFYVRWENKTAWKTAYKLENVAISGDTVSLAFNPDAEQNITVVEDFNDDPTGGFVRNILTFKDGEFIQRNLTDSTDGSSVEFIPHATFRLLFIKQFDEKQDWSQYLNVLLNVKTINESHGQVKMFFVDETGIANVDTLFSDDGEVHRTPDFLLLETDETTSNADPLMNDFEVRTVDLASIPFRDAIKGIVIWTDDLSNSFSFLLDAIRLTRDVLLPASGMLKLRYSTSKKVTFQQIEYVVEEPSGTDIAVRAKASNGTVLLNRADYTPSLFSAQQISLSGTDIEIEIVFTPNSQRTISPILESVKLLVVTDAEIDGFSIDSDAEFGRGDIDNINIEDATLSLTGPVDVGSYVFSVNDKVLQVQNDTSTTPSHTMGELAVFGINAPIAPNQVFRSVELGEQFVGESAFYYPRFARRLTNRSFLIADTYNDRILHFDETGNLLDGFGSINYSHNTLTFPISACVDIRSGILYVVWSKTVPFNGVNINRFIVQYQGKRVSLISGFDLINNKQPTDLSADQGQVMPIYLSAESLSLVKQFPMSGTRLQISDDAIATGIGSTSEFYKRIVNTLGIPVFIGNFFYTEIGSLSAAPVFSPTSVDLTDKDTYLIANAKINVKGFSFPATAFDGTPEAVSVNSNTTNMPSIVEIDPSLTINKTVFTSRFVDFSPFVAGRVMKIGDDTILAAGLKPGGTNGTLDTDMKFDFRNIGGPSTEKTRQKKVLDKLFFGSTLPFVGAVRTISTFTDGGAEVFRYDSSAGLVISDADTDNNGDIIVAESSFVGKSGRIIKLEGGNIAFSFGEGLYQTISSIEVQNDGSIVISS